MFFTGFADEASQSLEGQIRATKELGWRCIEARNIDGRNIHDMPEDDFERACEQLEEAGVEVNCFGSTVANWSHRIDEPFDETLETARRAVPRMKRLGTGLIRVMSFQVLLERGPEDQMEEERFRRLRTLTDLFLEAGVQPVHENCANYGGMGHLYTLRLIENVPGLKLVFDTGNPVFSYDRTKPPVEDRRYPIQSSWEFYENVRDHVAYVHVKDGHFVSDDPDKVFNRATYCWPGEGEGDVKRIVGDLLARGYDGGFSMEPHMSAVFHDPDGGELSEDESRIRTYVEYGRRFMALVDEVKPA